MPPAPGTSSSTRERSDRGVVDLKKEGKARRDDAGPQGEVEVQGTQKDKAVAINFSVQTPTDRSPS